MKKDLKISFEFFPPKNLKMHRSLWNTLNKLKIFYPDFDPTIENYFQVTVYDTFFYGPSRYSKFKTQRSRAF